MNRRRSHPLGISAVLIGLLVGLSQMSAAPPDLTAGEAIPDSLATTWNLGPTGMRGWVYYDTSDAGINGSVDSRQIQVREVDLGSPADGVLAANDVILGASGDGSTPVNFTIDARRGLAEAIADAEAQTPAELKLIRWRAGSTSTVTVTLQTMGAYSATAPYSCPKSAKILGEGMDYYYNSESSGRYRMGALSLLAAQDDFFPAADRADYLQEAETEARALIKSSSELAALRDYTAGTGYPTPWGRAHELILLGEYYLITGDTQVYDTIEALAINIAKGASHYGTMAHSLRSGGYDASNSYRPVNTGYGVVNSIGMPCLLGVQLAKQCGVSDPVIDEMIDRAKMFYAAYANRGAIPYGEHEPFDARHENNGKSGLAAILLDNDPAYEDEAEFFVMMALASGDTDRDVGHTGTFFNYLWAPLGVQRGGASAVQEYFKKVSWMMDLHRRWDGGFDYDSYSENRAPNGNQYYDFRMSTAMLLTYALPLESLHITGRDSTGALALSAGQVSDSIDVEDYDAEARTTAELVGDLGGWSPKIRRLAAMELGTRTIDTATRDDIRAKALDVNGSSRYGAIQAIGETGDTGFTGQLVSLLNDNDGYVRTLAAKSLHQFHGSHKEPYRASMMNTLVTRDRPAFPVDPADPLQFDQAALATAIFGGGAFANNRSEMDTLIADVGSTLFYDALKVASRLPTGGARGRINNLIKVLTPAEVEIMAPELVDLVAVESPADRMFSLGVRNEAMRAMAAGLVADAVPAAMQAMDNSNGWGGFHDNLLNGLIIYGGSSTLVTPDPDVVSFAQRYLTGGTEEEAQSLLDVIAADTNPTPPVAFKSIQSATADDTTVNLPADTTTLRVTAIDHAEGDSVFTWSKLSGPGAVTFTPNGTGAAAVSTVQFDGTPGIYQFEVTMSDSRGLTEVYQTVGVALSSGSGGDVSPPTPNPATFAIAPAADDASSISMTATSGSDASGPVEYLFTETSGNPGATSSQWQTSPSYTDSGLTPETTYSYTVTMRDVLGNTGTASASADATTFGSSISGQLGILDVNANGGINPNTGLAWQVGDQYRLAFHTAGATGTMNGTSNNPSDYNNYVTAEANANPALAGSTWFAMVTVNLDSGTTQALSAKNHVKDNTGTADLTGGAGIGGAGVPVYAMDGSTCIARNNADIWNNWSNPFDGNSVVRVNASQSVHYSPFLDQFGNQTVTPDDVHGVNVATGAGSNGDHVNALGDTTDNTTYSQGSSNANSAGRVWNRFTANTTTSMSFYAISEVLIIQAAGGDTDPPTPNPAAFASAPTAISDTAISMTAMTGSDASGPVEYYFAETSGNPGGADSGWQISPSYTDDGLSASTQYAYTVTMRDAVGNAGNASSSASATTLSGPDVIAPNPDPMTWAAVPAAGVGSLTVHEPFDYSSGGDLTGSGGSGFGGAWVTSDQGGNLFYVQSPGLGFSDGGGNVLPASGSSASRAANAGRAQANRELSASARSALFADGSTMWFSVLYQKTDASENAAFVIGSGTFDVGGNSDVGGYVSGDNEGFGFGSSSAELAALGYDDSGGMTKIDNTLDLSAVRLIAGKVVWGAAGASDTLYLYNVTDLTTEPTTELASVTLDLDQSAFDRISLLGQKSSATFDEIRLGSSFATVVGGSVASDTDTSISMTATTAVDALGVEYYFTETSGNFGGDDSGWQDSPHYVDTGLLPGTEYTYTVMARDKSANQNATAPSVAASATTTGTPPADTTPPTPNPPTFASAPSADSDTAISMTATAGSDPSGPVQYLFTETSGNPGGDNSGWQTESTYTDYGLDPETQYSYTVTLRDAVGNEGLASVVASATTQAAPDTTPPTPNPPTFAVAPAADSDTAISMTATTGSDPSGPVEYLFTETSGNPGGTSSGWQPDPTYTDDGLTAATEYTYTVTLRDAVGNTGPASTAASATTVTTTPSDAVQITDVFGHNEKDNFDGKINDMIIGSGMNTYGVDGKPGWPSGEGGPSTWTATSNGYQSEWQSQDLLGAKTPAEDLRADGSPMNDGETPTNGKVGWVVFDLGSLQSDLENLYLWHVRENNGRYSKTFNVYLATSPAVAPAHGPTSDNSRDYDFASGGWTLLNTGGVLNGAYQGDQVVSLGGAAARYVGIEMMSNNGDANRVGFAEVAITSGTAGPDTEAPVISSLGPEDDATDVAVSANLVATFDEEIAAATGLITIKNLTDATEGTIDITDGTQVSISGAVLTIDPAFDLEEDKDYAIQIASAAIEDTSGNDFGGIEDDVTWSFTTESSLIQIGPGADLAGASSSDGAGGERLNIALSSPAGDDFVTLMAGTYTVVDFQLSVDDHNAGIDGAGTVAPMLLTGSSGSWTTLWVGGDVDPTSNGVQTAASYPPDGETFTLSETTDVYAGIFTKNQGSAIPSTNLSVGRTDHDSSFVAPSGPGETINGISNPNLQRAYAFEVNVVPGGTPANSFANYISDPAFGLAPEEQGLDDDPDGDGIGNGVENFFGTNPGAFSQGLVAGAANQGEGTFTFSHPHNDSPADDLTAVYRWSKDLATFTADGTPFEGTTVTFTPGVPAGGMVTVTATVTGIGVDRLFVDVEVTP